jgi:hypothetical protein
VPGIVTGEAAPFQTIIGELIPFLARYFTGLTSNAYRRIGEESGGFHTSHSA